MGNVTGSKRQEEKIANMAAVTRERHPGLNELSVKGAFRFGIAKALGEHGFESWSEAAQRPAAERRKFFKSILDHAGPHIQRLGLSEGEITALLDALSSENEKYLQ